MAIFGRLGRQVGRAVKAVQGGVGRTANFGHAVVKGARQITGAVKKVDDALGGALSATPGLGAAIRGTDAALGHAERGLAAVNAVNRAINPAEARRGTGAPPASNPFARGEPGGKRRRPDPAAMDESSTARGSRIPEPPPLSAGSHAAAGSWRIPPAPPMSAGRVESSKRKAAPAIPAPPPVEALEPQTKQSSDTYNAMKAVGSIDGGESRAGSVTEAEDLDPFD